MTTTTSPGYRSLAIMPAARPAPAKIKPTSPRGTMPTPTSQRRTPFWYTARPAASFDTTAMAVSSIATPNCASVAKGLSMAGFYLHPDCDEEHGHEQVGDRLDVILNVIAPLGRCEDEPGGEGS